MSFKLDIYTWPAMTGINPEIRSSDHETPEEAIAHLDSQTDSYHLAVLLSQTAKGWEPCDWNGIGVEEWPVRRGTNGHHPNYLALMADWSHLVSEVRKLHDLEGRGTMEIANELLQERHPNIYGWVHDLGWAAAG